MSDPSNDSEKPINLFVCALMVRTLQRIALHLPPIDKVLDVLDARELADERDGKDLPREALKLLRPILLAAREFQNTCLAEARQFHAEEAEHRKAFAVNIGGGLC